MSRWFAVTLAVLAAGIAQPVDAVFRAADLVIVPAAAATPGLENSEWHTDLEIRNADEVAIDVMVVLLPSGGIGNTAWFASFTNHLGGRSEDGFAKVDERLKDIPPGGVVILEDVVRETWGEFYSGALLVFAYEAGTMLTTTPPGGVPRLVTVTSRTYTVTEVDDDEDEETPAIVYTSGQGIPGLPWYDYIDPGQADKGLDKVVFTGIREDEDFRTNIGIVNISDPLTTLEVQMVLSDAAGTVLRDYGLLLSPLAHDQFDQAVRSLFGFDEEELPALVGGTVTVAVRAWQSTADVPAPALLAYTSRVDNKTNDPTYGEQAFSVELPWDCVFNGNCTASQVQLRGALRDRRRPLAPPTP